MAEEKQTRSFTNSARINPITHSFVVVFIGIVIFSAVAFSGFMFQMYFEQILVSLNMWGSLSPRAINLVSEMFDEMLWLSTIAHFAIMLCFAGIALYYMFKFTGAEHALARHIRDKLAKGEWEPVHLRKRDALNAIAEELNKLSEIQSGAKPVEEDKDAA